MQGPMPQLWLNSPAADDNLLFSMSATSTNLTRHSASRSLCATLYDFFDPVTANCAILWHFRSCGCADEPAVWRVPGAIRAVPAYDLV